MTTPKQALTKRCLVSVWLKAHRSNTMNSFSRATTFKTVCSTSLSSSLASRLAFLTTVQNQLLRGTEERKSPKFLKKLLVSRIALGKVMPTGNLGGHNHTVLMTTRVSLGGLSQSKDHRISKCMELATRIITTTILITILGHVDRYIFKKSNSLQISHRIETLILKKNLRRMSTTLKNLKSCSCSTSRTKKGSKSKSIRLRPNWLKNYQQKVREFCNN